MKRLRFWKLDAFTDGRSGGNPAGLVWLEKDESLDKIEMQQLAKEVAMTGFVSEVAFARATDKGGIQFRYFSCEREVPFCGHATVASLYHLLATRPEYASLPSLSIETQKGMLVVENRVSTEDCIYIAAPAPVFTGQEVSAEKTYAALGFDGPVKNAADTTGLPIVECGQGSLLVPVSNLSILLACAPR